MLRPTLCCALLATALMSDRSSARGEAAPRAPAPPPADAAPLVLGHGVGLFTVGELVVEDNFDDLDNWVVQVQDRPGFAPTTVAARDNSLDCLTPGRGCTVWFKRRLPTRVTITYDVLCPTHSPAIKGVAPRDINNFWMCSDPAGSEDDLFDAARYNGAFDSYDKLRGYYASTGGGGPNGNRTTRMRRYPRAVDGRPAEHVALTDKDGRRPYLIAPDRWLRVQLVAFDDIVQYIVDGKLVYQFAHGDQVRLESRDADGRRTSHAGECTPERCPVYREGYTGLRMVGTHHLYRNFRVHALDPVEGGVRRPTVRVSSLEELRQAAVRSNQQVILEPGEYTFDDRRGYRLTGSNNDFDLTGAHITIPLRVDSPRHILRLQGDNITLRGGRLEDVYPDGQTEITDYGAYNQGPTYGGRMTDVVVSGDGGRVVGLQMTVRGSYPYGYGNMFGIGGGAKLRLRKHCGLLVTGDHCVVDGCDVKNEAFGHAIFVQQSQHTVVRNSVVEGTLRPSDDCYNETDPGDLAARHDFRMQWPDWAEGVPIPRGHMINCTEDGIRAYNGVGHMEVEFCEVRKARGGIKVYMAKSARVTDCRVLDCVVQGYSVPSGGVISRCSGNAAYGPLLYIHSDNNRRQTIDLEVLPAPHGIGDHPLAAIKGSRHTIRFAAGPGSSPETMRPIIVGYPLRFDFLSVDFPAVPHDLQQKYEKFAPSRYKAERIRIENETRHPVVLAELSEGNQIESVGPVRDLGRDNRVTQLTAIESARRD